MSGRLLTFWSVMSFDDLRRSAPGSQHAVWTASIARTCDGKFSIARAAVNVALTQARYGRSEEDCGVSGQPIPTADSKSADHGWL